MSEHCPDDEVISDYLDGGLSSETRAATDLHLDQCDECRVLISELARSTQKGLGEESPGPGMTVGTLIA